MLGGGVPTPPEASPHAGGGWGVSRSAPPSLEAMCACSGPRGAKMAPPRWARSEAWTDSRGWFVRDVGNGDTHASGRCQRCPFYEPQAASRPLQAPFWGSGEVMQSARARGPWGRFRGLSYQNTPLEWSLSGSHDPPQHPSCTTRPLVRTLATQNIRSPCIESAPPLTSHTHIHAGRL